MQDRFTSNALALAMAVAVTLGMLAGVNGLAAPHDEQTELAQDSTPVHQVVVTGHRARG